MSQDQFITRLGRDIIRIAPDGKKTIFSITTYKVAEYLHSLQKHGYTYQTIPVIHNSEDICTACEG